MTRQQRLTLAWLFATAAGALLVVLAYAPGLGGPFLFDDFGNLNALGAFGPIDDWKTFLYYMTSGTADPTGRPVSLLTFLLDAQSWPADPAPFKRTNLILHLVNALLLGRAISVLQSGLQTRRAALQFSHWTPWLAALLWAAHPLFVSTTLYVVQRQAMLPMAFTLLALLAWQASLCAFARGLALRGWAIALLGFGGATMLAGLSKANGFLAPMLVGLCHAWFLRPAAGTLGRRQMDIAALLLLALPSLLIVTYVIYTGWALWPLHELQGRDWTLPERLLTQPRVLWHYVGQLLLPRSGGGGVYVEGFPTSHGWFDPPATLPALIALAGATTAAFTLRTRLPRLSFAWLFFLVAHLLESSTIPLEMYFEHRNYLPAAFLGWPLVHALVRPGVSAKARGGLLTAIAAGLLFLTWQRAVLWGDADLLAEVSALQEPDSARSQVFAAQQEVKRGDLRGGHRRILALQRTRPDSVDVAIAAVGVECTATGQLTPSTLSLAEHTLATAKDWNYGLYVWMQRVTQQAQLRDCLGFGTQGLSAMVTAAERNPRTRRAPDRQRDLLHVRGLIALRNDDVDAALAAFNQALARAPDAEYALVQAAELGSAGAPAAGVRHLDIYEALNAKTPPPAIRDMAGLHAWLLAHNHRNQLEIARLRRQLVNDALTGSGQ